MKKSENKVGEKNPPSFHLIKSVTRGEKVLWK